MTIVVPSGICCNMDKQVGMREFLIDTSKWLKEAPLVIYRRGVPVYRVVGYGEEKEVIILAKKLDIKNLPFSGEYGCGCKREDGKPLCSKHGRV